MTTLSSPILLVIPTYRRPDWTAQLLDLLPAALADCDATVIVLDNDPRGSGARLAHHAQMVSHDGWRYVHAGRGDVVSARNLALDLADEAGVGTLAMLDDDELPRRQWLSELLRVGREQQAHVVAGPVRQLAGVRRKPWVQAALDRTEHPEGLMSAGDVGSGNFVIDIAFVREHRLRFDPRLGGLGGEDTLFFRRARTLGARVAWAPTAAVEERNHPDRLTAWALTRRIYRNGRSSVLVDECSGNAPKSTSRVLLSLAACSISAARALGEVVRGHPEAAYRQWFQVARHVGRLAGRPGDRRMRGAYGP